MTYSELMTVLQDINLKAANQDKVKSVTVYDVLNAQGAGSMTIDLKLGDHARNKVSMKCKMYLAGEFLIH